MTTKGQILMLHQALNFNYGNQKSTKFNWAILKNSKNIKAEVSKLSEMLTASQEFIDIENKRLELAKGLTKKDENGNPMTKQENGRSIFVLENEEEGNKQLQDFLAANKEVYDKRQEQVNAYNKALMEESTSKLYKISIDDLPKDLSMDFVDALSAIIIEESAVLEAEVVNS
jgi:hypothetical protein